MGVYTVNRGAHIFGLSLGSMEAISKPTLGGPPPQTPGLMLGGSRLPDLHACALHLGYTIELGPASWVGIPFEIVGFWGGLGPS